MDRIAQAFARARSAGRPCLVAYICAGDPDYDTSLRLCKALAEEGVDILELGVPFSDPLADGQTNQLAAQRALDAGMTQAKVLKLASEVRAFAPELPLVFYTYCNLVFSRGEENYAREAKAAGVDALLTLDCPPEESGELVAACRRHGLSNIYIVAPTTPDERIRMIAGVATGFIYYVSREGVTGVRDTLVSNLAERVGKIKEHARVPVVVGFGVSRAEHVREICQVADGAVVGSFLVNCIPEGKGDTAAMEAALRQRVRLLLGRPSH